MTELKREYRNGRIDIVIWKKGDEYTITYNQIPGNENSRTTGERFLEIQETPCSEVVGVFYRVNDQGVKAVTNRLFDNMLEGRLKVLTHSDLEEVLCEK